MRQPIPAERPRTNAAERASKLSENIAKIRSGFAEKLMIEAEQREARIGVEVAALAERALGTNPSRERRKSLQESIARHQQIVERLFTEAFCSLFYKAIVLDDDFKEGYRGSICETAETLFSGLLKSGAVTVRGLRESKSQTVRDLYALCEEAATKAVEAKATDLDAVAAEFGDDASSSVDRVAETVQQKVAEVLRREQDIAQRNKELESTLKESGFAVRRRESPTLFRAIFTSNTAAAGLSESGEKKEIDSDMVLAESIIMYTLLETLQTSRILEFTAAQAQQLASRFGFVK